MFYSLYNFHINFWSTLLCNGINAPLAVCRCPAVFAFPHTVGNSLSTTSRPARSKKPDIMQPLKNFGPIFKQTTYFCNFMESAVWTSYINILANPQTKHSVNLDQSLALNVRLCLARS
jgi:hypothetical protein